MCLDVLGKTSGDFMGLVPTRGESPVGDEPHAVYGCAVLVTLGAHDLEGRYFDLWQLQDQPAHCVEVQFRTFPAAHGAGVTTTDAPRLRDR